MAVGHAFQYVLEVGKWLHVIELCGGQQRGDYRPARRAAGIYTETLPQGEGTILHEQHNDRKDDNLSSFLLAKIGLTHKRIRRNKAGDTNSLSFRNIARLLLVNEEEIIQQRSPLSDGNLVADCPLMQLESTITCPKCDHQATETMPTDACQFFYNCKGCGERLKPRSGDCCVFCSYGSVPCPPIQQNQSCCS